MRSKKEHLLSLYSLAQKCFEHILAPITPISLIKTLSRATPLLPFYHIVSDNRKIEYVRHLYTYRSVKEFKNDIDFFLRNYSPITLADLLEGLRNSRKLPKNPFLLTFDDGFREIHDIIAPILKKKGVSAIFFLTWDFLDNKKLSYRHKASILIERYHRSGNSDAKDKTRNILLKNGKESTDFKTSILSVRYDERILLDDIALLLDVDFNQYLSKNKPYLDSQQVEKLITDGFSIGAHSVDHPLYSEVSLEEQLYQTRKSVMLIADRFSLGYRVFACPYSDCGVSKDYFRQTFRYLDASFGTAGMMKDIYHRNFQRLRMENTTATAKNIVAKHHVQKLFLCAIGKNRIKRN